MCYSCCWWFAVSVVLQLLLLLPVWGQNLIRFQIEDAAWIVVCYMLLCNIRVCLYMYISSLVNLWHQHSLCGLKLFLLWICMNLLCSYCESDVLELFLLWIWCTGTIPIVNLMYWHCSYCESDVLALLLLWIWCTGTVPIVNLMYWHCSYGELVILTLILQVRCESRKDPFFVLFFVLIFFFFVFLVPFFFLFFLVYSFLVFLFYSFFFFVFFFVLFLRNFSFGFYVSLYLLGTLYTQ